ncbi:MAG: hypothetical protein IPG50_35430 [Myxococcales bacterium]|nr:hypothetical protein [Myxococcales bacterium]
MKLSVLVTLVIALTGCNTIKEKLAEKLAEKVEEKVAQVASSASITSAETAAPKAGAASLPLLGAEAPPFKLVEKPAASDAPSGKVQGSANGHAFDARAIYFEPYQDHWQLKIADAELKTPTGLIHQFNAQTITVDLPKNVQPSAGKKFAKAMKYGDGFFQIIDPRHGKGTTSWNTDNAYYVEITKWDVKPFDPKGHVFQEAGKASGKVYVVHKAHSFNVEVGFRDSGAAGEFKDVVVRYMGKPKWVK